ncbi:MAG: cupin, partial [Paracoccaceae bacterium]
QGKGGNFVPFRILGFEARDTTIKSNTKDLASVVSALPLAGQTAPWISHDGDILISFVISRTNAS